MPFAVPNQKPKKSQKWKIATQTRKVQHSTSALPYQAEHI